MNRRLRLLLGTELPVAALIGFAVLPWLWMMLSSIRPAADLTTTPIVIWPQTLTLVHHIELLGRTLAGQGRLEKLHLRHAVASETLGVDFIHCTGEFKSHVIQPLRDFLAELKRKAGLPSDFWSSSLLVQRYRVDVIADRGSAPHHAREAHA